MWHFLSIEGQFAECYNCHNRWFWDKTVLSKIYERHQFQSIFNSSPREKKFLKINKKKNFF